MKTVTVSGGSRHGPRKRVVSIARGTADYGIAGVAKAYVLTLECGHEVARKLLRECEEVPCQVCPSSRRARTAVERHIADVERRK